MDQELKNQYPLTSVAHFTASTVGYCCGQARNQERAFGAFFPRKFQNIA